MQSADRKGARSPITVIVADRHPLVRRALTRLVAAEPGYRVVARTSGLTDTAAQLRDLQPQLLLVEPETLGARRLAELPGLHLLAPATSVVVLADGPSPELARQAELRGAAGTVVKHATPDELFAAFERALADAGAAAPAPGVG